MELREKENGMDRKPYKKTSKKRTDWETEDLGVDGRIEENKNGFEPFRSDAPRPFGQALWAP